MNEFDVALQRIWQEKRTNRESQLANYIPELAIANPKDFGIALVGVYGKCSY